jgi:hypothetical protein
MFNLKGWGACIPNGKNRSRLAVLSFLSAKSRKANVFIRNFSQSCQKIANSQDRDMQAIKIQRETDDGGADGDDEIGAIATGE